jgi:hypothetical protein
VRPERSGKLKKVNAVIGKTCANNVLKVGPKVKKQKETLFQKPATFMEGINIYYEKQTKPKTAYVLYLGSTRLEFRPNAN